MDGEDRARFVPHIHGDKTLPTAKFNTGEKLSNVSNVSDARDTRRKRDILSLHAQHVPSSPFPPPPAVIVLSLSLSYAISYIRHARMIRNS